VIQEPKPARPRCLIEFAHPTGGVLRLGAGWGRGLLRAHGDTLSRHGYGVRWPPVNISHTIGGCLPHWLIGGVSSRRPWIVEYVRRLKTDEAAVRTREREGFGVSIDRVALDDTL